MPLAQGAVLEGFTYLDPEFLVSVLLLTTRKYYLFSKLLLKNYLADDKIPYLEVRLTLVQCRILFA